MRSHSLFDHHKKVVVFGEILFDIFYDKVFLGGAPLNFAVHSARLGLAVSMISCLGNDDYGKLAMTSICENHISPTYISVVDVPTGTVRVTLDEDKLPTYTFSSLSSYDKITFPLHESISGDLFYFGTLAQRSETSRNTLYQLLENFQGKVFLDLNFRQNYYTREIVEKSLQYAHILKINEEELFVLNNLLKISSCEELIASYSLEVILLTLGEKGCKVYTPLENFHCDPRVVPCVSTVGAGDAFSAGFVASYLEGKSLSICAHEAIALASKIVQIQSAF